MAYFFFYTHTRLRDFRRSEKSNQAGGVRQNIPGPRGRSIGQNILSVLLQEGVCLLHLIKTRTNDRIMICNFKMGK